MRTVMALGSLTWLELLCSTSDLPVRAGQQWPRWFWKASHQLNQHDFTSHRGMLCAWLSSSCPAAPSSNCACLIGDNLSCGSKPLDLDVLSSYVEHAVCLCRGMGTPSTVISGPTMLLLPFWACMHVLSSLSEERLASTCVAICLSGAVIAALDVF